MQSINGDENKLTRYVDVWFLLAIFTGNRCAYACLLITAALRGMCSAHV